MRSDWRNAGWMAVGAVIFGGLAGSAEARQIPGVVMMKLKANSTQSQQTEVLDTIKGMKAKVAMQYKLVPGLLSLALPKDRSVAGAIHALSRLSAVEYAEPSFAREPMIYGARPVVRDGNTGYNPPAIPAPVTQPTTWVEDPKESSNTGTYQNGSSEVRKKYGAIGSLNTVIAVIDTGVDYTHPDIVANLWRGPGGQIGWDFFRHGDKPFDEYGHGTHVAGIAAGVGGNGQGIAGVCPRCAIMDLKFIGPNGEGSDADAIAAMEYAVANKANIINCSWGSPDVSSALEDAFKAVAKAGIFIAVAAGNDGDDLNLKRFYPASYTLPGKVSVAALYPTNIYIPFWSNFGWWDVQVSSAGVDTYSSLPGGQYGEMSGTSMASPAVAGSAGLVWSAKPSLKSTDIVQLFHKHIRPDADSMQKTNFGGRPDLPGVFKALGMKPLAAAN